MLVLLSQFWRGFLFLIYLSIFVEVGLQSFYYLTAGDFLFRRVALPIYAREPHAGFGNRPGLSFDHRTKEFHAHYYINQAGFRVPRPDLGATLGTPLRGGTAHPVGVGRPHLLLGGRHLGLQAFRSSPDLVEGLRAGEALRGQARVPAELPLRVGEIDLEAGDERGRGVALRPGGLQPPLGVRIVEPGQKLPFGDDHALVDARHAGREQLALALGVRLAGMAGADLFPHRAVLPLQI